MPVARRWKGGGKECAVSNRCAKLTRIRHVAGQDFCLLGSRGDSAWLLTFLVAYFQAVSVFFCNSFEHEHGVILVYT